MEEGRMDGETKAYHETLKPRLLSILYLTLVASIGGLVFGYYVGFIIAQFGEISDLDSILHEIVQTGLVGAILGAAAGGWTNDCLGRRCSILIADALIFFGAVILILLLCMTDDLGSNCLSNNIGNTLIGLGVGMASMTSPLYISEFSPPKLRDILVNVNFILYGYGKLVFLYLYKHTIFPSRYIIALAGLAALSQFYVMFSFPESPMWLIKKKREDDAIKVLKSIYTCYESEKEFDTFKLLIRSETTNEDSKPASSIFSKIRSSWSSPSVRRQFIFGTCLQAAQQLVGINVFINSIPNIYRMIGFGPSDHTIQFKKNSLFESYGIPPIFGGFCCTLYLGVGKRRMLRWGLYWMLGCVLGLSFIFILSPGTTKVVSRSVSDIHFEDNMCSSYITTPDVDSWECSTCLTNSTRCGFCHGKHHNILGQSSGASLVAVLNGTSQVCTDKNLSRSKNDSERNDVSVLGFLSFSIYTFAYSGSLEIIPWIINSQMYPTEVRGIYGGMAAAVNWIFFLVMILLSFFFMNFQGPLFTFLLISLLCFSVSVNQLF
ncbi:hypothetical protein MKW94_028279 [Papaver nudicaule]|uniref:Major facilitator superfamily (MFS) profile domain-containing protein n=1 Tax=Papaver nudicaule TaxID=74823 RepID=A0AA41VPW5_PAPNU|nr:hypothetical protein [Papaver nudicaule]